MSLIDSLLDEIDDELGLLEETTPSKGAGVITAAPSGTSGGGATGGGRGLSESDSEGVDIDVDQLDDLIADIERQDSTRRLPAVVEKPVGRKNPKFRQTRPRGPLDGEDLDRILEEIQSVTKRRAAQAVQSNVLGWGVLNTERKFDFMAPSCALPFTNITATLVVYTAGGTKSRIPLQSINIKVVPLTAGAPPVQHTVTDNKDGTYNIEFEAQLENVKYQILVDVYSQRQFEWEVQIANFPDPAKCVGRADPKGYKTGVRGEIILQARDKLGKDMTVGGAQVGLSFSSSGSGTLQDVSLLDKMDGTYSISFVPSAPGSYEIFLTVSGAEIQSPLTVTVH